MVLVLQDEARDQFAVPEKNQPGQKIRAASLTKNPVVVHVQQVLEVITAQEVTQAARKVSVIAHEIASMAAHGAAVDPMRLSR